MKTSGRTKGAKKHRTKPSSLAYTATGRRLKNKLRRVLRHNVSPSKVAEAKIRGNADYLAKDYLTKHGKKALVP